MRRNFLFKILYKIIEWSQKNYTEFETLDEDIIEESEQVGILLSFFKFPKFSTKIKFDINLQLIRIIIHSIESAISQLDCDSLGNYENSTFDLHYILCDDTRLKLEFFRTEYQNKLIKIESEKKLIPMLESSLWNMCNPIKFSVSDSFEVNVDSTPLINPSDSINPFIQLQHIELNMKKNHLENKSNFLKTYNKKIDDIINIDVIDDEMNS